MKETTTDELLSLQEEDQTILLDLYATWCGPCKTLTPKLERISEDYKEIHFLKMDVNKNMDFIQNNDISSVPTVLIYKGKKLIKKMIGLQPDGMYKDVLNDL